MSIFAKIIRLATASDGATMVEYGIVLLFIMAILVGLTTTIGQITSTFFNLGNSI